MKAIRVGKCHQCNEDVYLDEDGNSVEDYLPAGDWDWVCYPCQFKMQGNGAWDEFKEKMLILHCGFGKCDH